MYNFRLLVLFFVAFSLATLAGATSANFRLPSIPLANATVIGPGSPLCQTTGSSGACSEFWYPAGPSMSLFQGTVFTNAQTEYSTGLLASSPTIDFTDSAVPAGISLGTGSQLGGLGYWVTGQIPALGYYEIQFMLANSLLGCNMAHGNSACGINIRQGIAHMIDKTIFAARDPGFMTGTATPIDNPIPSGAIGGLLSPDSCLYDNRNISGWFNQTNTSGSVCSVGAGNGSNVGGGSYHIASATGADGFTWLQAPGSKDLDEAAAHFVMAGIATGCDGGTGASSCLTSTDSKLSGVGATCPPSCGSFFIRNDNPPLLDLGEGLEATMCYILTGTYGTPGCSFMPTTEGPNTAFPGSVTSTTSESLSWQMYTAAFQGPTFYDGSLYFTYNSAFVSGIGSNQIKGGGPCSNSAVPTQGASNYMYLCNSTYDGFSNTLETSPCLSAAGDPVAGATSNAPSPGTCGTGQLSSHSAGIQAEAQFGQNVYTIPIFETNNEYGYLQCSTPTSCNSSNSWVRADNNAGRGLPNYFTWLNAYNPGPSIPGGIRYGIADPTTTVNPYVGSLPQDRYVLDKVYDHLYVQNPLSSSQFFNWMTENTQTMTVVSYNGGVASAPPGTAITYRFTLRPDLTFQDGRPVTSYDVAFSYLSEVGNGAFLAASASVMTGVTILSPTVFDIGVSSTGPFVLTDLTSVPILPGRYWTNPGQTPWDTAISACSSTTCADVQYTLSGSTINCTGACGNFPSTLMTVNPNDLSASFDPTSSNMLIGSGPWQCGNPTNPLSPLGSGCFNNHIVSGAPNYTLTAYTNYFRSSERLAIYLWAEESDTDPIGPATAVGFCVNQPVNLGGACGHWQQGIGNPGSGTTVGVVAVGNVDIFFNLNWIAPFEWATNPPLGIAPFPGSSCPTNCPLTLYGLVPFDGSTTYTPKPIGFTCTVPNTYYDC